MTKIVHKIVHIIFRIYTNYEGPCVAALRLRPDSHCKHFLHYWVMFGTWQKHLHQLARNGLFPGVLKFRENAHVCAYRTTHKIIIPSVHPCSRTCLVQPLMIQFYQVVQHDMSKSFWVASWVNQMIHFPRPRKIRFSSQLILDPLSLNEDGRIKGSCISKLHCGFQQYAIWLESQCLQSYDDFFQIWAIYIYIYI